MVQWEVSLPPEILHIDYVDRLWASGASVASSAKTPCGFAQPVTDSVLAKPKDLVECSQQERHVFPTILSVQRITQYGRERTQTQNPAI